MLDMATTPRSPRRDDSNPDMPTEGHEVDPEGVVDNIRHLLPLVSQADQEHFSTSKRVRHLNQLAKVIKYCGNVVDPYYPVEKVIINVRLALVSSVKEVRAGALRVLRYLLHSRETFLIMLKLRIDILVVRSLDVPAAREIERLQAVRFVRQVISTCPNLFPVSLAAPLVSIVLYESDPLDNLTWSATATLCELALLNPEVATKSGGVKAILKGLLKCQTPRISESIILTLNYLLNRPDSRKYVRSNLDLESLLAPITDLHYRCIVDDGPKTLTQSEHDVRAVQASKMAVVSMLKSWPGLICLCSPDNTGLTSLLSMLPLTQPQVQREILDILYCVFQLKVPTWTDNFQVAIASVDPVQPKSEWALTEGFVVEEGKDLLPPKYGSRTNLVDSFHALLLAVVMEEGLFESLVEVVRTSSNHVRVMTTILMGELLHMSNTILPSEVCSGAHYLSELIASAMDFDTQAERNRATEVISYLDRVHQQKKEGVKTSSLYLRLILEQSRYTSLPKQDQELLRLIPNELEEVSVLSIVRDTEVSLDKDFTKWKWNLIFSVLQHPSIRNQQVMEDATFGRFIKRLCNFFKPSCHQFSNIRFSEANQKTYSTVGKLLVKYLCTIEENFSSHLVSLLQDIVQELSQVTASKLTADVFSASAIAHKMSRDYFLLLGTISFLRPALLDQCRAYGPLLDICNYQNRSDLMKLLLSTLDFGHNIPCRVILSKLLTSTDKEMRLYATRHMRVLLRAKMPFFNSWGLELLVPQLYDLDRQVALEAVEILDEACEEENFLEALLLQNPALLHLGEKGAAVFTRFISIRRGFSLLQKLGLLEPLIERWYFTYSKLYVYIVEEKLAEALTSFKVLEEGQFVRRTNTNVIQPNAFVPVHFYGQLVQHEEGCALLEKMGHVKKFCETIRQDTPTVKEDVIVYKAAIWALGHIGSTQRGLELLLNADAVNDLIELAEECPLLSIRGTCYYSLCLISKTMAGVNVLFENRWIAVRHSAEEKWPLIFEAKHEMEDALPTSPEPSPVRFFPPLFGSFDLNSLPRRSGLPKASSFQVLSTPYTKLDHSGSNLSLSSSLTPSLRRIDTKTPPRSFGRKTGKKLFTSLKDRERHSPSLSRMRVKSSADMTRLQGSSNTISHQSTGLNRPMSISTGELLSPDLHKASPVSQTPGLHRVTSLGQPLRTRNPTMPFIGVCIPIEVSSMFEYEEDEYKGYRTRTTSAPNFDSFTLPHDPLKCLECSLTHRSLATSSLSSLQQQLSTGLGPSSGSHTTDSSTAGSGIIGSYPSKEKSLDATPSPDAPRTLHIEVGSSHENVHVNGESDEGGGGSGEIKCSGSAPTKESPLIEKRRVKGSPLVRMKHVQSRERIRVGGEDGRVGETGEEGAQLDQIRETNSDANQASKDEDECEKTDSDIIRLTPPPSPPGQTGNSSSCEDLELSLDTKDREEEEEEEEEGEEAVMTEDDETEDELDEEEEEEEGEGEEEDSVSPSKEVAVSSSVTEEGRTKKSSQGGRGGEGGDTADTVSVSSVVTTQSLEDSLASSRQALHKAVLEIVYSLSSDVSLKKNSQGLNQVCQKYTELGDDLCLYSKVSDMLSTYHYNLLTRRFIQSKFQHMTYEPLFAAKSSVDEAVTEDDLVSSSAASSRRESYCSIEGDGKWRRRSSTSDALRFRQRMRQTSSHESHEEIPNSEENPNTTDPTKFKYRTEPAITITAASGSSQESMDNVKRPANFYKEMSSSTEGTSIYKGPDPSDVKEGRKITTSTDTHSEETATDIESLIQNETYDL